jgi:hypothetical protein
MILEERNCVVSGERNYGKLGEIVLFVLKEIMGNWGKFWSVDRVLFGGRY